MKYSVRGTPLPDLQAVGLAKKMKAAAALIDEADGLRRRMDEAGQEHQRLLAEIKEIEDGRPAVWAHALRAGEEPPTSDTEPLKQRAAELEQRMRALLHAGDLSDAELTRTAQENAAEWRSAVQAAGEQKLAEVQELAAALSAKVSEVDPYVGVYGWLDAGARPGAYSLPMASGVSIEALVHERLRGLGLVEMGAVGEVVG